MTIILAGMLFLFALGITLYPVVSNQINNKYASEIHTAYVEEIQQIDSSTLLEARARAVAYNESIAPEATSSDAYSQTALLAASENYDSQLNITGNGIMGYVEIPKINVHLPVYHGTGNDSLDRGIGHLLGSSLPVGGKSTHAILTGHSGMATQKMFTDLDQLEKGDVFYLQVLDEKLAYQVDSINIVLPHDTSLLQISSGEDYCTLITCTPYGVNTHRLLVRGTRIPYKEAEVIVERDIREEQPTSSWEEMYMLGIWLGILAALVISFIITLTVLICRLSRQRRRRRLRRGGKYAKK